MIRRLIRRVGWMSIATLVWQNRDVIIRAYDELRERLQGPEPAMAGVPGAASAGVHGEHPNRVQRSNGAPVIAPLDEAPPAQTPVEAARTGTPGTTGRS